LTTFQCPTCGAEGRFGGGAPYAVCRYCKSLLVRSEARLEAIGRVADVPDDFSPLQVGVMGQFDGRRFSVVGRMRKVWDEGSWSEWCVLFEDQNFGWLAEAQGDWVMTFEQPPAAVQAIPRADVAERAGPGTTWRLDGRNFTVTDVKKVKCLGAEGELTGVLRPGESALSIDLRGIGLEIATVEFQRDTIRAYVGRFVEFAECRFTHLRPLEGWVSPN
jgi:hypothetical protein